MSNEIDNLVDCLLQIMAHSWQETGFGRMEIKSEKLSITELCLRLWDIITITTSSVRKMFKNGGIRAKRFHQNKILLINLNS